MIQLEEILELMEWLVGHLINEQRVALLLLQIISISCWISSHHL